MFSGSREYCSQQEDLLEMDSEDEHDENNKVYMYDKHWKSFTFDAGK